MIKKVECMISIKQLLERYQGFQLCLLLSSPMHGNQNLSGPCQGHLLQPYARDGVRTVSLDGAFRLSNGRLKTIEGPCGLGPRTWHPFPVFGMGIGMISYPENADGSGLSIFRRYPQALSWSWNPLNKLQALFPVCIFGFTEYIDLLQNADWWQNQLFKMLVVSTLPVSLQVLCFTCVHLPCLNCLVPSQPCLFLSASTPWMPSQCCSACSHAGSQCPCNSAEGKLLHGWLRWWLHHLVKNQGHLCAGKDITYLQHFSQCNCFSHINLKLQFRHMLLGCLSGAQTFRHFSNLIRNHVMVAVPP